MPDIKRRLAVLCCFLVFETCEKQVFYNGLEPIVTGWENEPSKLSASQCKKCHEKTHEEWLVGMHAQSWIDPLFAEAFQIEPREWCVHCHAPLKAQLQEYRNGKSQLILEGINCVACHVREGEIISATSSGRAPHPTRVRAYMSSSQFCAECHQFNFPVFAGQKVTYINEPMQNTFAEWKASAYERPCQFCHYEGHRLLGPHNSQWLADHFSSCEADFLEPQLVRFRCSLDSTRAHRMPTGDLFKSLSFEIAQNSTFSRIVFRKVWARFYGPGPLSGNTFWNRQLIHDYTIGPETMEITVTADAPGTGPLFARLVYNHHETSLAGPTILSDASTKISIWEKRLR